MPAQSNHLTLCLLGKTGNGKSATANTLLGNDRPDFGTNCGVNSFTMLVRQNEKSIKGTYGNQYQLIVIDTPGTAEENPNPMERAEGQTEDVKQCYKLKRTITLLDEVLKECSVACVGVNVFVLVFNISNRFTQEEQDGVTLYKSILGEDIFSERGIIVFTHGDNFKSTEKYPNFKSWCDQQEGIMKHLFKECKDRVVLVYNKPEDTERREKSAAEIIRYATDIKEIQSPYTRIQWDAASTTRRDIYLMYRSPILTFQFNTELFKLMNEHLDLQKNLTQAGRNKLLVNIGVLRRQIEKKREGRELFNDQLRNLDNLEQQITSFNLEQSVQGVNKSDNLEQPITLNNNNQSVQKIAPQAQKKFFCILS